MKRSAVAVLVLSGCLGACGPGLDHTPTSPSACGNLAGNYFLTHSNSCHLSSSAVPVSLTQTGCVFTGTLTGVGTLRGALSGSSADVTVTFTDPCSGTASGTARLSSGVLNGAYAGTQSGSGCCAVVSGSFTLAPAGETSLVR